MRGLGVGDRTTGGRRAITRVLLSAACGLASTACGPEAGVATTKVARPAVEDCPATPAAGNWASAGSGGPVSESGARYTTRWTGREALIVAHGLGAPLSAAFFEPCAGAWEAVPSEGAPRPTAQVAWIDGHLYAWSLGVVPDGARYARGARRWVPSGLPVAAATAPAIGSRVVLFDDTPTAPPRRGTILDVGGETIRETPIRAGGAPPAGRVLAAVAPAPGALFVFGGRARADPTPFGDGAMLDVTTGRWTPLPDERAPSPRFAAVALGNEREIVVWGGRDDTPLSDGARWRLSERRWIGIDGHGAPAWDERGIHALTARFLVVAAGREGARYDLTNERWARFDLPAEMVAPWSEGHALDDGTVLFAARDGSWFWRLDPRDGKWSSVPLGEPPRTGPAILVGGGYLFLWGGRAPSPPGAGCEGAACEPSVSAARSRRDGVFQRLLGR